MLALLLVGLVNIRFLFALWVVTLPFAQWSLYDLGPMNVYVDRLVLICLLLACILHVLLKKLSFATLSRVELLMVVFTLVCLISARNSQSLDRAGFGFLVNAYILPFLAYYLARSFLQDDGDIRRFCLALTVLGIYLAYVGICEQLYEPIVFPRYIVDPNYIIANAGRSVGPSLEPVGYGVGLVFCLLLATHLFFRLPGSLSLPKGLAFTAICATPVAIVFTYTRAIWIGVIISLLILFIWYPRGRRMFGAVLVLLFIGFVLIQTIHISKTEGSTQDVVKRDTIYVRISMAKAGLKMFLDAPFVGVGYLQAGTKVTPYFEAVETSVVPREGFLIHNTFINILAELGIIGFVPFVLILVCVIRDAVKAYKRSVNSRDIAIVFIAAYSTFMFVAMANNMYYVFAQVLLFSIAGMVRAKLDITERMIEGVPM
jgi:O-antigen ligase